MFVGVGIRNINLTIDSTCTIIGTVGAGKSSLLETILGELEIKSGSVTVNGRVSYAAQEPWLFEGTIKNNILFSEPYDEER